MAKAQAEQILMNAQPIQNEENKKTTSNKPATINISGNYNRTADSNYNEGTKKK